MDPRSPRLFSLLLMEETWSKGKKKKFLCSKKKSLTQSNVFIARFLGPFTAPTVVVNLARMLQPVVCYH